MVRFIWVKCVIGNGVGLLRLLGQNQVCSFSSVWLFFVLGFWRLVVVLVYVLMKWMYELMLEVFGEVCICQIGCFGLFVVWQVVCIEKFVEQWKVDCEVFVVEFRVVVVVLVMKLWCYEQVFELFEVQVDVGMGCNCLQCDDYDIGVEDVYFEVQEVEWQV